MTRIILLDIDGVVVLPIGYRAALRATVNYFVDPPLELPEEMLAELEKHGITSEWDMAPLLIASGKSQNGDPDPQSLGQRDRQLFPGIYFP